MACHGAGTDNDSSHERAPRCCHLCQGESQWTGMCHCQQRWNVHCVGPEVCAGVQCRRLVLQRAHSPVRSALLHSRHVRNQVIFANTMFQAVCYLPDECQLITGGTDRKVGYWEVYDGSQIRELEGSKTGSINGIDISSCGRYFATGGDDRVVKVPHCPASGRDHAPIPGGAFHSVVSCAGLSWHVGLAVQRG